MDSHTLTSASERSRQRGAALLTALVFLVVLTLLGIGVYSTTTSEEKMARNFRDKEIALQSAEAALNEAKILIRGSYDSASGTARKPLSEADCFVGSKAGFTCNLPPDKNVATLDLFSGSITGAGIGEGAVTGDASPAVVGVYSDIQPRYLVIRQYKPEVCGVSNTGNCYQIVAQGKGRLPNTRVNLVELFTY